MRRTTGTAPNLAREALQSDALSLKPPMRRTQAMEPGTIGFAKKHGVVPVRRTTGTAPNLAREALQSDALSLKPPMRRTQAMEPGTIGLQRNMVSCPCAAPRAPRQTWRARPGVQGVGCILCTEAQIDTEAHYQHAPLI